jgi:ATP-dependent DNA helicase RecG
MHRIFISSVQREFAAERRALKDYIRGDALLRRCFDVFLFEDLPASGRRADDVYLGEVEGAAIYLGLFGQQYGSEDAAGVSPTEREFDRATAAAKERLVFIVGGDDSTRHPKMSALIRKAGDQLIRRRVANLAELLEGVYDSLVEYLERKGDLRSLPFDSAPCRGAALADISEEEVQWFLTEAQDRQFPLRPGTSATDLLTHLDLLVGGEPTHAAILLFGRDPQRFIPASSVKCAHFHGTEVQKPIPSYQVFTGSLFELVDQAVDFVLSKVAQAVGTRASGPQAPVDYELPRDAVAEAIVNAVAHRNYGENSSIQVMLFADRLEVWSAGALPPTLTPESLRRSHPSIPHNPKLARALYFARYIEQLGTGTLDMIRRCAEAGLRAPDFRQDGGQFVQTLWRPSQILGTPSEPGTKSGLGRDQVAILAKCRQEIALRDILEMAGRTNRTKFRDQVLRPLLADGLLEMTIPEKPTSRLQKYRLTEKGRDALAAASATGQKS